MDAERVRLELLRPAADGLRQALRRMDEDDVPAGLRTLADSSARRIPPPILRKALEELAGSDWLRAETANEVKFDATSAPGLFVDRPEGWEAKLEALVESAAVQKGDKRAADAARALAAATEKVARLESEVKAAKARAKDKAREVEERLVSKVKSADQGRRKAEADLRAAQREAESKKAEIARLTAEVAELEAKLEAQRQLLERERRAAETTVEAPNRGWFPAQPVDMAAELDRIVLATRRTPLGSTPVSSDGAGLTLPAGIRPDRVEAVVWLLGQSATWLVDGYNLAFQLKAEPTPATRNRIEAALTRLVSLSAPATRAVLVFDSEDENSPPANRRVRRVFAQSADDWILAEAGPGHVVVSSDRRVREGAESEGAVGIWSEAVAAWIRETR